MEINRTKNILNFITGNNFSGRTECLKNIINQTANNITFETNNLYVGEQPTNYISAILPTVKDEIQLHRTGENLILEDEVMNLFYQLGFEKHFNKNPLSLSGGEQTILVILCNLLLNPENLCVDSTIEQLNEKWYKQLFDFFIQSNVIQSNLYISDNRIEEYKLTEYNLIESKTNEISYKYKFHKPKFIKDESIKLESQSITIKNLTFAYDNNDPVFENLNYHLEKGSIYHLKGQNGSGKSTLAKILIGVLKLKNGALLVNDEPYNSYKMPGTLCGYSFQNVDEQLFSNTVEKEILPYLKNEPKEYSYRRELYIDMFGLQDIRKYHPAEMPFVIRKRIAIASTLAMNKPWYILDEPTLGQDDEFVDFLVQLLTYLKEQGKGIIIISHCKELIVNLNVKTLNLSFN